MEAPPVGTHGGTHESRGTFGSSGVVVIRFVVGRRRQVGKRAEKRCGNRECDAVCIELNCRHAAVSRAEARVSGDSLDWSSYEKR